MMTLKLMLAILSSVLMIAAPVVFILYMRKKRGARIHFFHILTGIVVGFLCKDVLVNVLGNLLMSLFPSLGSNSIVYTIFLTFLSAAVFLLGLSVVRHSVWKEQVDLSRICGLVIGFVIADILGSYLIINISNITYLLQSADGTLYEKLTESLSAADAQSVIASYEQLTQGYYLYPGIMVIVSLAASYLLTVLMMREYERPRHRLSIVLVMTALVYLVTSQSSPLIFEHANPILLLFAGILFLSAQANSTAILGE